MHYCFEIYVHKTFYIKNMQIKTALFKCLHYCIEQMNFSIFSQHDILIARKTSFNIEIVAIFTVLKIN